MSETWVAFGALILSVLVAGGSVIWKLATNKTEIIDRITASKNSIDLELDGIYKKIEINTQQLKRDLEAAERRGAEPIFAIREKVSQVELYVRDYYVSKREYEKDHAQLLLALRDMQESIEKRLDSYEERMEKIVIAAQGRVQPS